MYLLKAILISVSIIGVFLSAGCSDNPVSIRNDPPTPPPGNNSALEDLPSRKEADEVQKLGFSMSSVFAAGDTVYFFCQSATLYRMHDQALTILDSVATPLSGPPRMLYVTTQGTIFISPDSRVDSTLWGLYRSDDQGLTWSVVLNIPVWRMTEGSDHALYLGNYEKVDPRQAQIYKSVNDGLTWTLIYEDSTTDHVHTIGVDPYSGHIYAALGDGAQRGQIVSTDRGLTWTTLQRGPAEGHTDVCFTRDRIIWASDNGTGSVLSQNRYTGQIDTLLSGGSQYIWFLVSDGVDAVYFGTITSRQSGGESPVVCGTRDIRSGWVKLIERQPSRTWYEGFNYGCYHVSANGYAFVSTGSVGYRVRLAGGPEGR